MRIPIIFFFLSLFFCRKCVTFPGPLSRSFSLSFVFSSLIVICLGKDFFVFKQIFFVFKQRFLCFILLVICWAFWICVLCLLRNLRSFKPLFLLFFFFPVMLFFCPSWTLKTWIFNLLVLSYISLKLWSLFFNLLSSVLFKFFSFYYLYISSLNLSFVICFLWLRSFGELKKIYLLYFSILNFFFSSSLYF